MVFVWYISVQIPFFMIVNFSNENTVLSEWVREIRDVSLQSDRMRFRRNMERIGEVAAYEISKTLDYKEVTTQTPLGYTTSLVLQSQPVLATILRAGVPLQQGLLNYFDHADCAFVAAYRKHHRDGSFEIEQHYVTTPDMTDRVLILADPMLATGASLILAAQTIIADQKPRHIHIVTAIACSVGTEQVMKHFPEATIWAAAIDEELTAKSYIVPGLGDAGDLAFGSKIQS